MMLECCQFEVEWENWFHTICHVEGQEPSRLAFSGVIGPENEGCDHWPLRRVAISCFDERVTDGLVLLFDDAIHPRVVC